MTALAGAMASPRSGRPPEARVVRVRASGFGRRFAAGAVDLALLSGIAAAATGAAALALGVHLPGPREIGPDLLIAGILDRDPMALGGAGLFLGLSALYQIYFGGVVGQTPGKRLLGIRIVSLYATPPGPLRGLGRLAALGVSLLPAGLGWIWALFDREHRALHDHLAGTYVILDR